MLKITSLIVLLLIFLSISVKAQNSKPFNLTEYYELNRTQSSDVFFQNFPYEKYLQAVSFTDFQTLQKNRFYLYTKFQDGDVFLYRLGDFFVAKYPLQNLQDVKQRIELGEKYLDLNKRFGEKLNNQKINEIYRVMGFFLLATAARYMGGEIKSGKLTDKSPELVDLIDRLKKNKVYIEQQDSVINKIVNSDIAQLQQRFWDFAHRYRFYLFIVSIITFLISLAFIVFSESFLRHVAIAPFVLSFVLFGCLVFDKYTEQTFSDQNVNSGKWSPNYSLNELTRFFPSGNNVDSSVITYEIKDSKNNIIGQAIWMQRPTIKASYFASQGSKDSVFQNYQDYRKTVKPVLVTTGGYSNVQQQPEGLTFDKGEIINAVLLHDREGLALFSCGGINVINLDDKEYRLPIDCDATKSIPGGGNPRESLLAYSNLLDWARKNNATLFQTHLLAHSNELRIDEKKASENSKERRILALVRENEGTGEPSHIIFNITKPHPLAVISKEIFAILKSRNFKVEAMINLDTGRYDILEFYNEKGEIFKDAKGIVPIKGTKNISSATNYLFYYIE